MFLHKRDVTPNNRNRVNIMHPSKPVYFEDFSANAPVHLLAQILARYSKRVVIGMDFGSSLHTLDLMDYTNFALCMVN